MVSPAGGTIDNGDACYGLHGNPDYWREEAEGEGGSLVWTNATDNPEPSNYAQWELYFEESGLYDVQVHIVQPFGESTQAGYRIAHAGGEEVVTLDQSANDGWVSLGAFEFDAAMAHAITLGDNTGEPNDGEVSIVFDAVQLTRLDMPEGTSGGLGESSGGDAESSGGEPPGGTSGDPSEGSSGGMESGPALPPEDGDAGGCGCRSDGSSGTPWLLLGLLGLLRRRRY
jgi:MYXO-CTERM domain-containing protein